MSGHALNLVLGVVTLTEPSALVYISIRPQSKHLEIKKEMKCNLFLSTRLLMTGDIIFSRLHDQQQPSCVLKWKPSFPLQNTSAAILLPTAP